jgi:hypothetical protein
LCVGRMDAGGCRRGAPCHPGARPGRGRGPLPHAIREAGALGCYPSMPLPHLRRAGDAEGREPAIISGRRKRKALAPRVSPATKTNDDLPGASRCRASSKTFRGTTLPISPYPLLLRILCGEGSENRKPRRFLWRKLEKKNPFTSIQLRLTIHLTHTLVKGNPKEKGRNLNPTFKKGIL